ncbi:MAG TPA: hypothetical protein VIK33_11920, partial [Anaerolineae bacterium]
MATNPAQLRGVYVALEGPGLHGWYKVEGEIVTQIGIPDPTRIVAWLESHGYVQHGAIIGHEPSIAVF